MTDGPQIEMIVAWYAPTEWDAWREACDDGDDFFSETFETWHTLALNAAHEQRQLGRIVRRVVIRLADFLSWAKANNKTTDSQSRAEFAGLTRQS